LTINGACAIIALYSEKHGADYMIKYTAHPEVLQKFDSIQRNAKKPWDDHYIFAVSICGSKQAYFECGDFWKHYRDIEFFSVEKRKQVPVNGIMVSVDYFTETVL